MIQPLSTVLSSLDRVRDLDLGARLPWWDWARWGCCSVTLPNSRGATVIGVDRVSREKVAADFGIDFVVHSECRDWAAGTRVGHPEPDVVIDAVGHRQEVVADAVSVAAPGGEILVFGLPEDHYVFPMRTFFRKGLSLAAGANKHWHRYLAESEAYVRAYPSLPEKYITHVFQHSAVEQAYLTYARPESGRHKVVVTS